ncbi:MAG: hypothetical protein WA871_10335 [Candidatus Acidiferrales bacterium]
MSRPVRSKVIQLNSFGTVTGFVFEDGGSVEMIMALPELSRLLNAWEAYEKSKNKPDEKLLAALDVLAIKARAHFGTTIRAEVPIAKWKAKLTPIIREE